MSDHFLDDNPVSIPTYQFLHLLFDRVPCGYIEVCYLAPEGVKLYPRTLVQWAQLPLGEIDPELPAIHHLNKRGYSCYFAPAVRVCKHEPEEKISEKGRPYTKYPRGKAAEASYITSLWVDIDCAGDPDQRAAGLDCLESVNPPASVIIDSGGGYHGYWLLNEPLAITPDNREMVKQTLKGLALASGGDTSVADLARIMRIPETINTKPGRGQACQIIDAMPFCQYHYMDFELTFAPLAAPPIPPVRRTLPTPTDKVIPTWVQRYLENGERQGARNRRGYAAARALLDNGWTFSDIETLVGNRMRADGLGNEEIEKSLASAENAPRGNPDVDDRTMKTRMGVADKRLTLMAGDVML